MRSEYVDHPNDAIWQKAIERNGSICDSRRSADDLTSLATHLFMKNLSPHIRPADVSDVRAMFHVRASVGENTLSAEALSAMGITPEAIALAITSSPCAWVATIQEEVVGFAMVDLDSACLFALFVLPGYEGGGIGTRLTQICERALFERHSSAWLETADGSRAAQLYRYLGWGNDVDIGGGDIRLEKQRA